MSTCRKSFVYRSLMDEEPQDCRKESVVKISDIRRMSVIDITSQVVKLAEDSELSVKGRVSKYLRVLSEKLDISPIQALFLSIFVDKCDDYSISYSDIARCFRNCRTIDVIKYREELDDMVERGIIELNTDRNETTTYRIPQRTLDNLCRDALPCSSGKRVDKMASKSIDEMNGIEIINCVIKLAQDKELSVQGDVSEYLGVLCKKFDLSPMQALLLSFFVKECDDSSIRYRDIANSFKNCLTSDIIKYKSDIDELVGKGFLIQSIERGIFGEKSHLPNYRVPFNALQSLGNDTLPAVCGEKSETPERWMETLDKLFEQVGDEELDIEEFDELIKDNFNKNQHLACVQRIRDLHLSPSNLKLYLAISKSIIADGDDCAYSRDVARYFNKYEFRGIARSLESGNNILMKNDLLEHACEDGMVNPKCWCFTSRSKTEIWSDFAFEAPAASSKLKTADSIIQKELYYEEEVSSQISKLKDMLEPERMSRIMEKLSQNGMRKGFACMFYGGPGTGKTETVLQLARQTGRSIMQVDIASIRDKYVGETEKRIKACFDSYRNQVKICQPAPILFFNEADALFTSRTEVAEQAVDKMENAMQNIILQEMENLEGILIATTNLTSLLDPAFERRFLFKIEFTKPSAEARRHIWQAMMPSLSDADALMLAERFDFSGGQIENIARKRMIDEILSESEGIDIQSIVDACRHEKIANKSTSHKIGFGR